ncbi:type I-E CRISPR-associated protein Cas6/Cse3/CasE [Marinobacter sp. G11]|uniref:type I-E CRISPR-associated protein Cas6/Cse3/CasE n=1 Tax=Marinobacter sp. G11 TaxID=2903522 RepID=UPI001E488FC3|nr:type I-E CRISPR-associated protein Cas6/Cse3/CasE [Marinobacter sp. G11]MCE0759464.1 type I-E CRISPR-associated protein Cas6/Cse3/CasE [Marinobacter sp. G11]
MNPMTVSYQEAGLMLPDSANRQDIHAQVYSAVSQLRGSKLERDYIYSVLQHPGLKGQVMVTLRGQSLPKDIPTQQHSQTFEPGRILRSRAEIVTMAQIPGERYRYRDRRPDELHQWLTDLVGRHGFALKDAVWGNPKRSRIKRAGTQFSVPSLSFTMTLEVVNPVDAASAWLNGIGRKKGYGFGMMEDISDE